MPVVQFYEAVIDEAFIKVDCRITVIKGITKTGQKHPHSSPREGFPSCLHQSVRLLVRMMLTQHKWSVILSSQR